MTEVHNQKGISTARSNNPCFSQPVRSNDNPGNVEELKVNIVTEVFGRGEYDISS